MKKCRKSIKNSKGNSLPNIKLVIAYDGTSYQGWQIQDNGATVQAAVEEALYRLHNRKIKIIGAGRTDSGVHAFGQCGNFYSDLPIPPQKFREALNSFLPPDIRVLSSSEESDSFHSRYDAKERIYKYYISSRELSYPWMERYSLCTREKFDIGRLNKIVSPLIGVHDFASFASVSEEDYPTERRVDSAVFYMERGLIVFKISADGFLRKMVRSIVGTLLELYRKGGEGGDMAEILRKEKREAAGACAPAKGLFLERVVY